MAEKLIIVTDVGGSIELKGYGYLKLPMKNPRRMDGETIRRLINYHRGPKGVYAISPDGKDRIKMTDENCDLTEEELFGVKEEKVVDEVVETPVETASIEEISDEDTEDEEYDEEEDSEEEAEEPAETPVENKPAPVQKPYQNNNKHHHNNHRR